MDGPPPSHGADDVAAERDNPAEPLARIAWSLAAIAFAIAGLVLLMESYYGYASVTFAVAVAAGINLL